MLSPTILVLLLALIGLLALFVRSYTLQRAMTTEFPTALTPGCAPEDHTALHTAKCCRPISYSPRKRWRRTPGMQSGLPPPIGLAG